MDLSTRQGRREQGLRIQSAVERAGLSIEELANRLGCSRALIYQYLSGSTLAQPDRLQQIAATCGVPLVYFYSETSEPTSTPENEDSTPTVPQDVASRLSESLRGLQDLADAQSGPPDYRALASTCERILSIASQLNDREIQTRSQLRLGNALLHLAEYPRAADALNRAIALAQETGMKNNETSARQSLGNAMLQMGRMQEAQEQFEKISQGDGFTGRWQGTLSLGCVLELRGAYQEAMLRFDEAAALLEEGEAKGWTASGEFGVGMLYVNTNRRNVYMDGGDFKGARPLAEKGLADAEGVGNADQHLEARFDLAWCDFNTGMLAQAYKGFTTTLQLARFLGDQGRENMTRAWLGIYHAAVGDYDNAISMAKDALAQSLSRGDRRSELYAQLALADAYLGLTQRESEARYHVGQALAVATALRHERQEIECRIRIARLHRQVGEWAEMKDVAEKALQQAQRLGARHLECLLYIHLAEASMALNPSDTEVRRSIDNALTISEEIGLAEGRWRAKALLAGLTKPSEQENLLREAVEVLETLRNGLLEAGIPDTLLENDDCQAVYRSLVHSLEATHGIQAADQFLEQTGWPPLTEAVQKERADKTE